ncbi:unnamed protein product [Blepharisma stoltei]|uniref:Uncharacterized protein n=1 Tax=Blepharisma stoltei TaxID=1481888 RepID=A0AAU9ICA2_9CILI|nr:unnamed protein product [Blepharisma stoltei]
MSEARNRLQAYNSSHIFTNDDLSAPSQRTRTPQNFRKSDSNFLNNTSRESPNSRIIRNTFANQKYNQRSEVLDGCVEQAKTCKEEVKPAKIDTRTMSPAGVKPADIDVSPRPRVCQTMKSSVFTPSSIPAPRISPHKPRDQESLLGSEPLVFYKKSINEHIETNEFFEPRYKEDSAAERKAKEFHGGLAIEIDKKSERNDSPIKTVKQLKEENLASSHFETTRKSYDNPKILKENNEQIGFSPERRKAEMRSSAIFDDRKVVEVPKDQIEKPDDSLRRKDANYSDLFGNSHYSPKKKITEKLISATEKWTESVSPLNKSQGYDPKTQLYKNLRASHESSEPVTIQTENSEPEKQIHNMPNCSPAKRLKAKELVSSFQDFKDYSNYTPVLSKDLNLIELDLKGLSSTMTDQDLKKICSSVHIVSARAEIDNFTGKCKGTGRIKVRTNSMREKELKSLEMTLAEKGIAFKNPENEKKCSNKQAKPKSQETSALVAKMKNLESSEVFGSAGRSSNQWRQSVKRVGTDEQFLSQLQWKMTRKA